MEAAQRISREAEELAESAPHPQQLYYLTPPVVAKARVVFDRYCHLEKRQQQNREFLLTRARSMRPSPTAASPRRVVFPRKSSRRSDAAPAVPQDPISQLEDPTAPLTPPRAAEPSGAVAAEPLLGVEGLQQFFKDLDVPLSALEVAELVHTLEDEPIDFAAAAAQAQAQAAAAAAAAGGRTSPQKKTKSRRRAHSTKDSPREAEVVPASAPISARKRPARDGVDFSHFLFILSHVVPEKEDTAAVKNAEIDDLFRLVDKDGDGVISMADVRAMAQSLAEYGGLGDDRDIQRLLQMSATEIEAAVMECDVDGDGRLSAEDLRSSLRS